MSLIPQNFHDSSSYLVQDKLRLFRKFPSFFAVSYHIFQGFLLSGRFNFVNTLDEKKNCPLRFTLFLQSLYHKTSVNGFISLLYYDNFMDSIFSITIRSSYWDIQYTYTFSENKNKDNNLCMALE